MGNHCLYVIVDLFGSQRASFPGSLGKLRESLLESLLTKYMRESSKKPPGKSSRESLGSLSENTSRILSGSPLDWMVYKVFPFYRGKLQGCGLDGFDLIVRQCSVYFPDGFSVTSHYYCITNLFEYIV